RIRRPLPQIQTNRADPVCVTSRRRRPGPDAFFRRPNPRRETRCHRHHHPACDGRCGDGNLGRRRTDGPLRARIPPSSQVFRYPARGGCMSEQLPKPPHPYPGKLITVEGIDGSGKSTQLLLLHKWLESKGHRVFFTEWNSSELVKDTTKRGKKNKSLTPTTFSLLQATNFASRLYHEILPPLKAGMIVLADRYMYTAFARDVARGVSPEWIRKLYSFAITPDMAFYFKVPIEVAISRLLGGTRGQFKYYEAGMDMNLNPDVTESFRIFQSSILAQYDKIVDEFQLITLDATKDIEAQQNHMRQLVGEALKDYKPRRGTHGRRTVFWRRFDVPKSE